MTENISITIQNTVPDAIVGLDFNELEKVCRFVLAQEQFQRGSLSLVIVGDEEITALKKEYFDIDQTTDVVSFNLADDDSPQDHIDAEVVINAELAVRESLARGSQAKAELFLYAVHGILHQAGYDDHNEDDYREMHERENEIMTLLGYGSVFGRVIEPDE